ncbi:hypothetical protein Gohar_017342 [Gossypium harknessii]|uniref:Uncharacterized protein n=1 Tax=Gossypium harknessii TaxID=34285 RepID=A0A7J9G601_9ROSI|nr:hypothetical protein [Gossypium harknessii]
MALKEETEVTKRALSRKIEELKGELSVCRAVVDKGVLSNKFESSKPKGKGNGEKDKEGQVENCNDSADNKKQQNGKRKPYSKLKGPLKCFLSEGLHMVRDCPKQSVFSAIQEDNKPKKSTNEA